jgi:hypothetical protein
VNPEDWEDAKRCTDQINGHHEPAGEGGRVIHTVLVRIENTYACGRESASTEPAPAPGADVESWWNDVIGPLAGDGHPCGSREHALYEARIVQAPGRPELVGQTYSWEG